METRPREAGLTVPPRGRVEGVAGWAKAIAPWVIVTGMVLSFFVSQDRRLTGVEGRLVGVEKDINQKILSSSSLSDQMIDRMDRLDQKMTTQLEGIRATMNRLLERSHAHPGD